MPGSRLAIRSRVNRLLKKPQRTKPYVLAFRSLRPHRGNDASLSTSLRLADCTQGRDAFRRGLMPMTAGSPICPVGPALTSAIQGCAPADFSTAFCSAGLIERSDDEPPSIAMACRISGYVSCRHRPIACREATSVVLIMRMCPFCNSATMVCCDCLPVCLTRTLPVRSKSIRDCAASP